jgi:hypothetical protein
MDYLSAHKKLKIGVLGTHDTGKTTLAFSLCSKLKSKHLFVGFVEESVRECPFPVNQMTNFLSQYWILNRQINYEIEKHERYNVIVTDRTTIDNFAYAFRAAKNGKISPEELEILRVKAEHWARTYNFLFYARIPKKKLEDDGFRDTTKQFQLEIDQIIRELIKDWKLDVTELDGTNDRRLEIALQTLSSEI